MTNQEKQQKLVEALADYIARYVEENSPVTPTFQPYGLTIAVCGTENLAMLRVSRDTAKDGSLQLRLQLGVARRGTDRLFSNFSPALSQAEILPYLHSVDTHRQWQEQIEHLSAKVDAYWNQK